MYEGSLLFCEGDGLTSSKSLLFNINFRFGLHMKIQWSNYTTSSTPRPEAVRSSQREHSGSTQANSLAERPRTLTNLRLGKVKSRHRSSTFYTGLQNPKGCKPEAASIGQEAQQP